MKAQMSRPRIIKKYPNRRLYDTEISSYVTLEDIRQLVQDGEAFEVQDAKTQQDLTRSVLLQIITEREEQGQPLLTTNMLSQLIRFYGDSLQGFMGSYLERSMQIFLEQQTQFRTQLNTLLGQSPWAVMTDLTERNLQLWQQLQQGFGKPPPLVPPGSPGMPAKAPEVPISNKPRGK
jgi:polyhydroxyalkanoate synthesis repressor PhaR